MEEIKKVIAAACKDLFSVEIEPVLTRPDEQLGDYATNIAMQLATKLNKNPREIAEGLVAKIESPDIAKTEVAGPGFINITLQDTALLKMNVPAHIYSGKTVVAEYSDPNPFKVLHAGHLYTSIVGDAIASLFEAGGGKVHRVNYGGDVGLHVAKTMWAIKGKLGGEYPEKLKEIPEETRADWMAKEYITGSLAYGDDERIDNEIKELNTKIYQIHEDNDKNSPLAQIYWTTRQWSYDYFDEFYKLIGTEFEKYYPESEVAELGIKTVKKQLEEGVFEKSDGAVVFPGDKHDLHIRVFINSEGLPTYEAKEVGLILTKKKDYDFDISLIITGNEQAQYMQVVIKALEQFEPELARNTIHLTHGMVKLKGGVKMSSRKGNILRAVDVLDIAAEANKKLNNQDRPDVVLGAVKYSFLKQGLGADIIYDPDESVAIHGNSGPYLQYAHARARSILRGKEAASEAEQEFEPAERSLLRKISEYTEVVERAIAELMPHHVCTYLYELAQNFNRFYEENRVLGDPREAIRLQLVEAYAETLKNGLELLNIPVPEKM
jgi:arginyl-tRNA synthetase